MGHIADTILPSAERAVGLAELLLKDVPPRQFARKPSPGGAVINTNHPAFVYGHLSLYPARLLQMTGDAPAIVHPAGFEALFKAGVECRDDPDGTIYPAMDAITSHFFTAYRAVLKSLPAMSDETLQAPNPTEGRMRELFPTIGAAAAFLLGSHTMMHLGQVSAWRRCMGLGPVM